MDSGFVKVVSLHLQHIGRDTHTLTYQIKHKTIAIILLILSQKISGDINRILLLSNQK